MRKRTRKTITGVSFSSLLFAKFTKWCFSTDLSFMQFGFKEEVGCTEASFTILETINHMLERGSKLFGCFLDVKKAFDTVWIDGLLYKLFSKSLIRGRMWLAIKDL